MCMPVLHFCWVMAEYNLSRDLSLFYSHTVYRMPKDRYPHHMVYSRDGIFSNNLNVGVIYNINHDNNIFEAALQHRFFFEYAFAPSYLGRTSLSLRDTRGFDANASVGWWFSSAFALRAGVHVTNADWQHSIYANEPTKLLLGTRGLATDLLINPITGSSLSVSILLVDTSSDVQNGQLPLSQVLMKGIMPPIVLEFSYGHALLTVFVSLLNQCTLQFVRKV